MGGGGGMGVGANKADDEYDFYWDVFGWCMFGLIVMFWFVMV